MKTNLAKKIIFGVLAVLLFLVIKPVFAYNFITDSGLEKTANTAGYAITGTTNIETLIGNVIMALLSFVGVIFLILIIYGALTWMTAEGNDEKVKKAKAIITDSIIGLGITLSAYAITYFLVSYFWK
ncbi:MAG: hypothetical protein ACYC40_00915 [Patescibacteria group bacterium]